MEASNKETLAYAKKCRSECNGLLQLAFTTDERNSLYIEIRNWDKIIKDLSTVENENESCGKCKK